MFNVGLSEMVLVLVVGCLVTDPKKLPGLLKTAGAYYRKFTEIKEEVWNSMREACGDSTGTGYAVPKKRIMGDDGVLYEAYEVSDVIGRDSRGKEALDASETGRAADDASAQAKPQQQDN
ncbi:hypothetical protein U370_01790 [Anaplasma marginale str. Dawn]|nr:twin-arginine translocase TatA/TatE family subunit [Anaplasma marginale]AGZ78767.1 hypothetical protein U128_01815 [Anaplasma marginale str. Gypsy Plains]AGZ79603.1 hypothetical protein U370_01790 [Anaplasma marginale str. Dawn]AXW83964.1 hypothetical protein CQZ76_01805 [Anaplasma marginale]AXW84882.1 hypothetical protein BKM88_01795 [Anaplasma marginale]KAA8473142.1 hypothetical protein F0Q58_00585 [Anaplasma marginale]